jgi:hypothetical protein
VTCCVFVASIVNIAVCYFLARPVQGVGILLPGLVPAAAASHIDTGPVRNWDLDKGSPEPATPGSAAA